MIQLANRGWFTGLDKSLDECTDLFCFAKLLLILNFGCFHDNESLPLLLYYDELSNYLGDENRKVKLSSIKSVSRIS